MAKVVEDVNEGRSRWTQGECKMQIEGSVEAERSWGEDRVVRCDWREQFRQPLSAKMVERSLAGCEHIRTRTSLKTRRRSGFRKDETWSIRAGVGGRR